jgi:hypothetical protein
MYENNFIDGNNIVKADGSAWLMHFKTIKHNQRVYETIAHE